MDSVAQSLSTVQKKMDADNITCSIVKTCPTRDLDKLDEASLYVIRQQVDAHGVHHFIVAAKMAKGKDR